MNTTAQILIVAAGIGLAELGIMFFFQFLPQFPPWLQTPIDALFIAIVAVFLLHATILKSMKNLVSELRKKAEELESKVQDRTADLTRSNQTLNQEIAQRETLEANLKEQLRLASFTADVGVALTRTDDLKIMLNQVAKAAVSHLDAAFARIWTLNSAENVLELQASAGIYTHLDGPHSRVPVGKFKIGLIAEERMPHLTNAVIGDPRVGDQEWAKREGMQAFAGYPLILRDEVLGVFALFSRRTLSGSTLQALASIADSLSTAISRKRAEEEVKRNFEIQKALGSILKLSPEKARIEEVLENALDVVLSVSWISLQSKGCVLLAEKEGDTLTMAAQRGLSDQIKASCKSVPFGTCLCGRTAASREMVFSSNLDDQHEITYDGILPHGHYCVPLMASDKVLGVMNLYLNQGHVRNRMEEEFLSSAARALAGLIERKQGLDRITQLNQDLEGRVLERTKRLDDMNDELILQVEERLRAFEALRKAKEEADLANRAKGEFLANMSHEIRTPLNAITGLSHLALQTELPPKARDQLEKIHSAGNSLLRIINDILDFSKIEAGKLDMERIPFFLRDVFASVGVVANMQAREKGLAVTIDSAWNDQRPLIGDPLRLTQVLLNLLNNAIKFTKKGEVGVSVHLPPPDPERPEFQKLQFTVRDTGIGMTPDQIARLFRPFSQADTSTTRKFGGSGLGLSICKRLTEMQSGEMTVESVPGKGSTFVFTAEFGLGQLKGEGGEEGPPEMKPCAPRPGPQNWTEIPSPGPKPHSKGIRFPGARVLLVEDNPINQEIAGELLKDLEIEVDIANDGLEALDFLVSATRSTQPDAILMDVQMPNLDGYETTRRIRQLPRFSRLPIIAMTANALKMEQEKALAAGMNDYVTKPVNPGFLVQTLAKWVFPLPAIPGILVVEGLARVAGNRTHYRNLLLTFAHHPQPSLQEIETAIVKRNDSEGRALAHSFRGLAGNLGMADAFREAADIEAAIRAGSWEKAEGCLDRLRAEHVRLANAIREALQDS